MRFSYKVMICGEVVAEGVEQFSSAGNAELMLRARWAHLLTSPFQRCWNMIQVVIS